ncbi:MULTISPECIES: alpha/beta hydrolase [unclassified Paenibacillus]|uniref:alpha/beta hydrolase n=1 Tax=unclassified Paenibacillus TaxID=185978 RepID=UPI00104789A7|nr:MULTISPECIES: alpha/beta hydrolase [unclassified Paenibacillus]NIK71208.1 phospholipase/carboxylesterase [Paenibacillus sp. BK720]TCM97072.1 phospholipase/carboxylesterase [Paenibacillus sp. BK033]
MKHIFRQGTNPAAPVLVLFHGTGGTEHDLLPLAAAFSPESSVLSIRGNVSENGMARYFRRIAEGVFDLEDLVFRTKELNDFLDHSAEEYGFDRNNLVAAGYSNGANIAGSLLFHYKDSLRGAILHHPMVPIRGLELPDLSGVPVFIGAGENDPICSAEETNELESLLAGAGAAVDVHWERFGHQLTRSEVSAAAAWYKDHF